MSDDFTLEELKRCILCNDQPLGMDELLLLMSDYIGDEEINKEVNSYVDDWYKTFDSWIRMRKALEAIKITVEEGLEKDGERLDGEQ